MLVLKVSNEDGKAFFIIQFTIVPRNIIINEQAEKTVVRFENPLLVVD